MYPEVRNMKSNNWEMIQLRDMDVMLEQVKKQYKFMEKSLADAKKELNEWNKDAEIQAMQEEVNQVRRNSLYVMTDKEHKAIEAFRGKHYISCKSSAYQYELAGTGIGTIIKIKCPVCGEQEDVTDLESW